MQVQMHRVTYPAFKVSTKIRMLIMVLRYWPEFSTVMQKCFELVVFLTPKVWVLIDGNAAEMLPL